MIRSEDISFFNEYQLYIIISLETLIKSLKIINLRELCSLSTFTLLFLDLQFLENIGCDFIDNIFIVSVVN